MMQLIKNRTVLIIILLVLISVFLLVVKLIPRQKPVEPSPSTPPSQIDYLNPPAELQYELDPSIKENLNTLLPTTPLVLNFNQPIIYPSLKYSINPNIDVISESGTSNTQLVIKPQVSWKINTKYSLIITELKAQGGANLNKEINLEFETSSNSSKINYPIY